MVVPWGNIWKKSERRFKSHNPRHAIAGHALDGPSHVVDPDVLRHLYQSGRRQARQVSSSGCRTQTYQGLKHGNPCMETNPDQPLLGPATVCWLYDSNARRLGFGTAAAVCSLLSCCVFFFVFVLPCYFLSRCYALAKETRVGSQNRALQYCNATASLKK